MEHLNELLIENLIEQMDVLSLIQFYQASEKPMKQIIKTLIGYQTNAEKLAIKAIRECLRLIQGILIEDQLFQDIDQYYGLQKYGYRKDFLNEERKMEINKMLNEMSAKNKLLILSEYTDQTLITLHSLMYDPELTSSIRKDARRREGHVIQRLDQHREAVIENFLSSLIVPQLLDFSVAIGSFLEQSPNHPPEMYSDFQYCLKRKFRYLLKNFDLVVNPETGNVLMI